MDSTLGIILTAGGSTRMGSPKALLPLNDAPIILHHIRQMSRRCKRIVVVVGRHGEEIAAVIPSTVQLVENPKWAQTGPAESLLLALEASMTLAVVTPVDVPPVKDSVLDALLRVGGPAVPSHRGEDGHPVVIDGSARAVLAAGGTLREALRSASRIPVDWPDTTRNLNTPADWSAWIAEQ